MVVAIPLIKSTGDNIELRYSLRSLEQHYSIERLYIIGYCPAWLKKAIVIPARHNPAPDAKERNLFNKIAMVPECEFLYSLDDTFLLPSWDYQRHYKGTLNETYMKSTSPGYKRSVENTANVLGVSHWDYDCHDPQIIYRHRLIVNFNVLPINVNSLAFGYLVKTVHSQGLPAVFSKDVKIRNPQKSYDNVTELPYFSSSERAARDKRFIEFIKFLYPKKSSYE